MSEPIFLTTEQAADLLNTAASKAVKIFNKYKIFPVDFGKGRGGGLRWKRSEIIRVADALYTDAQQKTKKTVTAKRKTELSLSGKDAKSLFAELSTPIQ